MIDPEYARVEQKLWNMLMDPRTYRELLNKDGEPANEKQKVSYSWKIFKKWIEHG